MKNIVMKSLLVFITFVFGSIITEACDNCGCFMGITPYDNQSSIGMFYRYSSFNGYKIGNQSPEFFPNGRVAAPYSVMHNPNGNSTGTLPVYSKSDYEIYTAYELRANYFIHQRVELNFILPYNENKMRYEDKIIHLKSQGDATVLAGYQLIRQMEMEKKIQQRLVLGAGIKFSTGKHDFRDGDNTRYNFLIQPGTGSYDYLFYLNYAAAGNKLGLGISSVFKVSNYNDYTEKFTNSNNTGVSVFYKLYKGNLQLIPSAQLYYEYVKGMMSHGILIANTGSDIAMCGPGLDVYYKNLSLNFSIQYPVRDKTDSENLSAAGKMVAGLKYNFNQKKYLFHKKDTEK
ncbi:MAG: hypothetical protein ABI855_12095 [Bacteroidota bacterium]